MTFDLIFQFQFDLWILRFTKILWNHCLIAALIFSHLKKVEYLQHQKFFNCIGFVLISERLSILKYYASAQCYIYPVQFNNFAVVCGSWICAIFMQVARNVLLPSCLLTQLGAYRPIVLARALAESGHEKHSHCKTIHTSVCAMKWSWCASS